MSFRLVLSAGLAGTLFLAGCGEKPASAPAANSPTPVRKLDTAAAEKAFSSAEASVKATLDKAVSAVKNADYAEAARKIEKLLNEVKLTPEQRQALQQLFEQVKVSVSKAATDAAAAAAQAARDAVDAAKKSLESGK